MDHPDEQELRAAAQHRLADADPLLHDFIAVRHAGQWVSDICVTCGKKEPLHRQKSAVEGTETANDPESGERLVLNEYGRKCYRAGQASAVSGDQRQAGWQPIPMQQFIDHARSLTKAQCPFCSHHWAPGASMVPIPRHKDGCLATIGLFLTVHPPSGSSAEQEKR